MKNIINISSSKLFPHNIHYHSQPKPSKKPNPIDTTRNPFRLQTNIALYDNKILEESISNQNISQLIKAQNTISSKHPTKSRLLRSNSLHKESKNLESKYLTSMVQNRSSSHLSNISFEHQLLPSINGIKKLGDHTGKNNLYPKQNDVIKNKSMFPKRQFSRLHQSNNILPNSEDIRQLKLQPKASLQSNVPFIRFQNYQTIASLKSEMNLQSKKNNYKKKQRQVMQNFRNPGTGFGNGAPAFKSSSSVESGDSDQEINLEKAYCVLCGEDFRWVYI